MTTPSNTIISPYADDILPAEHQSELTKIRTCLTTWIAAAIAHRKAAPGAAEALKTATEALKSMY